MAGGEGTRLRPLTSNQPKPMVPIVGKPCMEHIVELLKKHGFEDIVVTLAFMPQAIRTYFGDGESLGLEMDYSVEEQPLGTAGSVGLADGAAGEHQEQQRHDDAGSRNHSGIVGGQTRRTHSAPRFP